uniref:Uncharacterized protein n=1 Tax=Anguilla anguilla TaxID=7936 RepID=A0A0E9S7M6_ANGAN
MCQTHCPHNGHILIIIIVLLHSNNLVTCLLQRTTCLTP